MLCVVKNKHITGWSLCCNDARVLGHVPSPIYFSFMVDFDFYFNFPTDRAKTSKFCTKNQKVLNQPSGVTRRLTHLENHSVTFIHTPVTTDRSVISTALLIKIKKVWIPSQPWQCYTFKSWHSQEEQIDFCELRGQPSLQSEHYATS